MVDEKFSLDRILQDIADVEQWKDLALHLGVPKHVIYHIEKKYRGVATQKREAISWWLDNDKTASWKKIANALLKAGYPLLGARVLLSYGKICNSLHALIMLY